MPGPTRDLFEKCFQFEKEANPPAPSPSPYFRSIETTQGASVVTQGRRRVMIGSNNYLGLTHHPRVREAAQRAIAEFGTGSAGSRFLSGNLALHERLEAELAEYLGKEACLVFSTGFLSNQGALSSLVGRADVIYSDRESHASIVEGTRVALGETVKFRHNDMEDLERVLQVTRGKYQGALLVADGIFAMSGAVFDLPRAAALARAHGCRIYIDDAHSLGVLGERGQGLGHHFGISDQVDLQMGTFSKAFASIGGFVAGRREVIDYVKYKARPFIFSAAMPPAAAATVIECLRVMREEPEHLARLWQNTRRMAGELEAMGYDTLGSRTPVIPLVIGDAAAAFGFTQKLYERGIFATPVVPPAAPEGQAFIRTSYMATHTDADLDYVLQNLRELGREFGVLDGARGLRRGLATKLTESAIFS